MGVIFGVCSKEKIPVFKLIADLLLDGRGCPVYASSGEESIFIERKEDAPWKVAKKCVGVAIRGGNCFYFDGEGEVVVGVGEAYGAGGLGEFAEGFLEAAKIDKVGDFMRMSEAEVTALLLKSDCVMAVRDELGCRILYYGSGSGVVAFSNRRSVVERAGLEAKVAPPGATIKASGGKIKGISVWRRVPESYDKDLRLERVVEELSPILKNAILKRSRGGVGVLFSGGLDSTLIASILSELGIKCRLYCSGLEGSKDVENAISTGEEVGLEVKVRYISEEELEDALPTVVKIVGGDVLNVELAIPLLFVLDAALKDGCSFVMNGTGADELFGGYSRFVTVLKEGGYEALQSALVSSLRTISERDLIREEEVAGSIGVLLRRPFLDVHLVEYAVRIPPQLKLAVKNGEYIRKYVLRRVAEHLHVPRSAVERKKLAFQYGSGVDKALRKIALKRGFTKEKAREAGFKGGLEYFLETIKLKASL